MLISVTVMNVMNVLYYYILYNEKSVYLKVYIHNYSGTSHIRKYLKIYILTIFKSLIEVIFIAITLLNYCDKTKN